MFGCLVIILFLVVFVVSRILLFCCLVFAVLLFDCLVWWFGGLVLLV